MRACLYRRLAADGARTGKHRVRNTCFAWALAHILIGLP